MDKPWDWNALLEAEPPERPEGTLDETVYEVLRVRARSTIQEGKATGLRWRGQLRVPAEKALDYLTPRFARAGFTALVTQGEDDEEVTITAAPGLVKPRPSRLWLAVVLFVLTAVSTFITGGLQTGAGGETVLNWAEGAMFSGALLSILLAHELGHFIASRRLGVAVSYPFFIPMPLTVFGTMGAFIQMKEPPSDRRALFTIAVAGPLAGLVVAIPLTVVGLLLSTVQPLPTDSGYLLEGNNLLYAAMKWMVFGQLLPSNGVDVFLHPVAFAGWSGMLVTALNLLPAGQLDGGHVIFALLGRKWGQRVTYGVVVALLLLGFVWSGWWIWAFLILFLANRHAPILNDVTSLGPRQRLLALITLVLFILLFTPTPLVPVPAAP